MLFQFHENFLSLFLNAVQQNREKGDIFSEMDYDAMMQAYASLPQMLQFVDFCHRIVETAPATKMPSQMNTLYIQKPDSEYRPFGNCQGAVPLPRIPFPAL